MEIQEEIKDLLEKAEWAPKHSVEKSDILFQALKLAETGNDKSQLLQIREKYVACLAFQGRHELALPHFALMLARLDDTENKVGFFDRITILWSYKWFLIAMTNFVNLSKEQIFATLADMERRFLADDLGNQRAVNDYKRRVYFALGDLEEAEKYDQLVQDDRSPRRRFLGMDDCEACVTHIEVEHYFWQAQFVEALKHAQPILDGTLKCASIPKETYPVVVLCYSLLGQEPEAEKLYKKAVKLLNEDHQELSSYGMLMCYAAKSNKLKQGINLFQEQIGSCLTTMNKYYVFQFYQASLYLFEQLKASGKLKIKLQIPENEYLYALDGTYAVEDLIRFFTTQIRDIAAAFDARNKNNNYSVRLNGVFNQIKGSAANAT